MSDVWSHQWQSNEYSTHDTNLFIQLHRRRQSPARDMWRATPDSCCVCLYSAMTSTRARNLSMASMDVLGLQRPAPALRIMCMDVGWEEMSVAFQRTEREGSNDQRVASHSDCLNKNLKDKNILLIPLKMWALKLSYVNEIFNPPKLWGLLLALVHKLCPTRALDCKVAPIPDQINGLLLCVFINYKP